MDLNYIESSEFDIIIETNKQTAEVLLDLLSDLLCDKGFYNNDNPNGFGIRLEKIINVIF